MLFGWADKLASQGRPDLERPLEHLPLQRRLRGLSADSRLDGASLVAYDMRLRTQPIEAAANLAVSSVWSSVC